MMQNPAKPRIVQEHTWPRHLAIGCVIGLALGCMATIDAYLLHDRATRKKATLSKTEPGSPPPPSEIADYLDGKSLPAQVTPAAGGTATQPQPTLVIRRGGIRDLRWESSSKAEEGAAEPWYHDYALLYNVGREFYVADISIRLRQIGERRAFLGYEVRRVEKADRVAISR
jgi:hypothetical protein